MRRRCCRRESERCPSEVESYRARRSRFVLCCLLPSWRRLLLRDARLPLARFSRAVSDAIDFNQHAFRMAEIAAHSGANRKGFRKEPRINRVVAGEKTCVAEMDRNFDHVTKGGTISLKNGRDVVDRQLGLLFN